MSLENLLLRNDIPNDVKDEIGNEIIQRKQVEETLIESEKNYRDLIQGSPDAIVIYTGQKIVFANYSCVELIRSKNVDDLLGRSVMEFIHPEFKEFVIKRMLESINTKRNLPLVEEKFICFDETVIDVEVKAIPVMYNKQPSTMVIIRDITERKKTEAALIESEKKFKFLVSDMQVGVLLQNSKTEILLCNPKALELLGLTEDQLIGKTSLDPDWNVIHEDGSPFPGTTHPVTQAIESGNSVRSVVMGVFRPKNKDRVWLLVDAEPRLNTDGNVTEVVCTFIDITEHKKAKESLLENKANLTAIIENTLDSIWAINTKYEIIYINAVFEQAFFLNFGIHLSAGVNLLNSLPNQIRETWKLRYDRALNNEHFEFVDKIDIGNICVYIEVSVNPIVIDEKVIGVSFFGRDVTERKLTENALKTSERRFKSIVDASPMGMHLYEINNDDSLVFIGSNPAADKILGVDHNIFLNKTIEEAFPGLEQTEVPIRYKEAAQNGTFWYTEQINYNNGIINGAFEVVAFQTEQGKMVAMFHEITERKLMNQQNEVLYELSQAYYSTKDLQDLFSTVHKILSRSIKLNNFFIALFSEDERLISFPYWCDEKDTGEWLDISADDLDSLTVEVIRTSKALLLNENELNSRCYYAKSDSFRTSPKCWLGAPLIIRGKVVGVMATQDYNQSNVFSLRDVTLFESAASQIAIAIDNKRATENLKISEQRFRDLFDEAPIGYHELDQNGTIIRINKTELEMLQYEEFEMLNHKIWEFMVENEKCQKSIIAKLNGAKGELKSYERTVRRKDGLILDVLLEDRILRGLDDRITGIRTTLQDISNRKKNEMALHESNKMLEQAMVELQETQKIVMHQERMRALGQMASGMAHDINNSLTPIVGYADFLIKSNKLNKSLCSKLELIKMAGNDVKKTIERMKEFYRPRNEKEDLKIININSMVKDTIELTRHKWKDLAEQQGAIIKIETEFESKLPLIKGDDSELREALVNLIFNAADAMPCGGRILLKTYLVQDKIIIEINDNGMGMEDDTLTHCMEPFFTTKGDQGTGLGLSMVYGIMQRHHGAVEIKSKIGEGTKIKLLFPVVETNLILNNDEENIFLPKLNVLCIDDNKDVLTTLTIILSSEGHQVEIAEDGNRGIEKTFLSFKNGRPFDVIITDLGMPGMDGGQIANKIKNRYPQIPIILLTGWGTIIKEDSLRFVDFVLKKPATIIDLKKAFQTVLNQFK